MLSIIVPTYNKCDRLLKTIQNIFSQNINDIQIIIIDDHSTDNTEQKIKALNNPAIIYSKNKTNKGTSYYRLKGIQTSTGNYIAFLDDDDSWMTNKSSQQLNYLKTNQYDFIMCNYTVNNTIDNIQYIKKLNEYESNFKNMIINNPGPFFQCCMFRRDFLIKHIDKFDSNAEPSEDWDFFIELSKYNPRIKNINQILFQWNISKDSQSANYSNETHAIEYILKKHNNYMIQNSSYPNIAIHYRRLAGMFYYIKKFETAFIYYKKAFSYNPLSIKNCLYMVIMLLPNSIKHIIMIKLVKKII